MVRLSAGEKGELIERIKGLIIRANKDHLIVKKICEETGLKKQMARLYLNKAHESLKNELLPERHKERIEAIARLKLAMTDCINSKRWRDMLNAQAQLNTLLGLDEPIKQDLNHSGSVGFVFEEIKTYENPPNHDLSE